MQVFVIPVTCDVCGGEGVARPRDAVVQWGVGGCKFGTGELRHRDPAICADVLAEKRRELERREKELGQ